MVIGDMNDSAVASLVVSAEEVELAGRREIGGRESRILVTADVGVFGEMMSVEPAAVYREGRGVSLVMEKDVINVLREEKSHARSGGYRGVLPLEKVVR